MAKQLRSSVNQPVGGRPPLAADPRAQREWDKLEQAHPQIARNAYLHLANGPPSETGWMYRCRGTGQEATVVYQRTIYPQWGLRLGDDQNGVDVFFFFVDPRVYVKRVKFWRNGVIL